MFIGLLTVGALYMGGYLAPKASSGSPSSVSVKIYELFPNGSRILVSPMSPTFSLTCGSCSGGGTAFSIVGTVSVSFSGDTITGGACSGTVSFNDVGGVTPSSQSVSGTGAASTSPMVCPMTAATVPFSDFSSLGSGTYTLTATLTAQGDVVFTHGGADSGVNYPATSSSASVSFTISDGVVTGVSSSVSA